MSTQNISANHNPRTMLDQKTGSMLDKKTNEDFKKTSRIKKTLIQEKEIK